jgi:hypothetical protein
MDRNHVYHDPSHANRTGRFRASGFPVSSNHDELAHTPNERHGSHSGQPRRLAPRSLFSQQSINTLPHGRRHFLLWREQPLGHYTRWFCSFVQSRISTFLPPSLHGRYSFLCYYGCSDPTGFFSCHPPWFADSRHRDCQAFCLQPLQTLQGSLSTPSTALAYFVRASPICSLARQSLKPNRVYCPAFYSGTLVTYCLFPSRCSPSGLCAAGLFECSAGKLAWIRLFPSVSHFSFF